MESKGFMDALSSQVQAERMRSKEKKAKKLNKTNKLTRTNSNGGSEPNPTAESKVEPSTPTKVAAPTEENKEQKVEEQMEGEYQCVCLYMGKSGIILNNKEWDWKLEGLWVDGWGSGRGIFPLYVPCSMNFYMYMFIH